MLQGRLNKARRGEVYYHAPIGYVRLVSGEFALDPDPQVQDTVRLLFDKLDELGTVTAVLRYLVRNQIRLGVRPHGGPRRGQLEWRRPCRPTLLNLYHNPIYAGAYVHGRRQVDPRRKIPGRPATGRTTAQFLQWEVLIKDHLPAYTHSRKIVHAGQGRPAHGSVARPSLAVQRIPGMRIISPGTATWPTWPGWTPTAPARFLRTRQGTAGWAVRQTLVLGDQERLDSAWEQSTVSSSINTSFVERYHGTDRGRNAQMARKTYRFSKDWCVHEAMTFFAKYSSNFCWVVRTLRQKREERTAVGSVGPRRWSWV